MNQSCKPANRYFTRSGSLAQRWPRRVLIRVLLWTVDILPSMALFGTESDSAALTEPCQCRWRSHQEGKRTVEHPLRDSASPRCHWIAWQHRPLLELSFVASFSRHFGSTDQPTAESPWQASEPCLRWRCGKSLDTSTWVHRRQHVQLRVQPRVSRDRHARRTTTNHGQISWYIRG